MIRWLKSIFTSTKIEPPKQSKAEFDAEVAELNRKYRESGYRANARMQAQYEGKWVKQYDNERKGL